MDKNYISYYFRNLCVETFPSYGTNVYYDTCIYNHFFELLLRVTKSGRDFDILVFINKYIKKLDDKKNKEKFEKLSRQTYNDAKNDFFLLISNIYQITLIYNYRKNLVYLEEDLLRLDSDRIKSLYSTYDFCDVTINLINNALAKVKDALVSKISYKYDIEIYNSALLNTIEIVRAKLESLELEDLVSKHSEEVEGYQKKVFQASKEKSLESFEALAATISDTFSNNRKIRHLKSVNYYLSFLMHDEILVLEVDEGVNKQVFKKFYNALYNAYRMGIYFDYFKNKYEKNTLKELLNFLNRDFINDDSLDNDLLSKYSLNEDHIDRRSEHIFFNIINNLEVRKDFKDLTLIILGYQLLLDANTIEKISNTINNNKNPILKKRMKDLIYRTNVQIVYDLDEDSIYHVDEDIYEFLESFNSYKIETVYEVNVVTDNGELETIIFDSEDDYKDHIRSDCDEGDIQYMVDNFLCKRDKKVYYDLLFTTGL